MNDFTKDELVIMYVGVPPVPATLELKNKIQSMIENYCEHEETENIGGWVSKCVKCGMKFGDETQ